MQIRTERKYNSAACINTCSRVCTETRAFIHFSYIAADVIGCVDGKYEHNSTETVRRPCPRVSRKSTLSLSLPADPCNPRVSLSLSLASAQTTLPLSPSPSPPRLLPPLLCGPSAPSLTCINSPLTDDVISYPSIVHLAAYFRGTIKILRPSSSRFQVYSADAGALEYRNFAIFPSSRYCARLNDFLKPFTEK